MKVSVHSRVNGGGVSAVTNFDSYAEAREYIKERCKYLRDVEGKEGIEFVDRPIKLGGCVATYDIYSATVEVGHLEEFANRYHYGKKSPF